MRSTMTKWEFSAPVVLCRLFHLVAFPFVLIMIVIYDLWLQIKPNSFLLFVNIKKIFISFIFTKSRKEFGSVRQNFRNLQMWSTKTFALSVMILWGFYMLYFLCLIFLQVKICFHLWTERKINQQKTWNKSVSLSEQLVFFSVFRFLIFLLRSFKVFFPSGYKLASLLPLWK